ncbi:MAG: GntR family transcriptional regulator [Bacteroidetes bacterium HGW-Bacteroidetes-1]|jgi:hypothetical protein|nr:MAG: GntR family transcriptional regulator [Bacteroidetes bacterium HGW-Bacteroidetes-1]
MNTQVTPGKINKLRIINIESHGAYLDGGLNDTILLPTKWIPDKSKEGDEIEVFIYFDSDDRIIATTMKPFAQINEIAFLRVADVNNTGAFLDWGLEKDLLVPYREQKARMVTGRYYLIYIYLDEQTGRIAASAKIEHFIDVLPTAYVEDQEVEIIIWEKTELGYKAIIENQHQGLIYANEVFQPLEKGMKLKAFVSSLREDGKIDLRLLKAGYEKIDGLAGQILEKLQQKNGFLHLTDHSNANDIYTSLKMSKKNFKKALGMLFKKQLINIEKEGIRLIK